MSAVGQSYLETEVLTAPPEKLRLMLIEAAIRWAQRAAQLWQDRDDEKASSALIRAQEIVTELLASINRQADPVLAGKVASVYLFVFRNLLEANLHRSPQKLDDALRVLREEQQTWRQVCARLSGSRASGESPVAPPMPAPPASLESSAEAAGGLSLEA